MSIARKVMEQPGRYSIQQLRQAMERGILPAYIAVPLIQEKTQMQKQFQQQQMMQQPPVKEMPPIAQQVMQEAQMMQAPRMAQAAPGVEGLPSNLPQEYAAGGIVAFGDGGEVERYQMGGELGMAAGMGGYEPPEERRWNPFTMNYDPLTEEQKKILAAAEEEQRRTYGWRPDKAPTGTPAPTTPPAVPPAAGPGAAPAGPGAGGPGGIASIMEQLRKAQEAAYPEQKSIKEEVEPLLKGFMEKAGQREAARKEEAARLRGQVTGKAYEGLEADLRKEAEQMGADKDQAKNMAIFKAGLAMMAGTSRNALQNIGAGAMVGAEDYQKAAADIKKAQKENRMMMAHIENARRAEQRGDIEKQVDELDKATNREEKRDEFFVSSLASAGIKDSEQKRQMLQNLTTVAGGIYGHQISGQYGLEAARTRAGSREELSGAKLFDARTKISQALKDENFELKAYQAAIGNTKLTSKQLESIKKDPKNANVVAQVEQLRRNEIEKRLREALGEYAPMQQQATEGNAYPGFKMVSRP